LYEKIYVDNHTDKDIPNDKRTKEIRRNYTYHLLAALRNRMLDKCVEINADYLLSCDSDILMRPDTLKRLLEHKEHCISSLVYNGYLHQSVEEAYKFSNCLRFNADRGIYEHVVSKKIAEPFSNIVGTTTVVHFTGACILISRELASKARYAYFNRGEDEPFCRSARQLGYNVLCDVSMLQAHIMSPHMLLLYRKGQLPHLTEEEV
jgi:GT2 family glycosyltransferase